MASELNVGGVKVGDGTANQNWVQVHSTAAQIAGVKLFRGDGDSSDASNNNFGLLVTDSGCEISKFTDGGANITGRVPFLTIDSDGNVGIGVTPTKPLTVKSDVPGAADIVLVQADDDGNLFRVGKDNSDNGYIELFDGSGNLDVKIDTSAASTFANGISVTTGGVKFPATQSASADANTLDDYEEGEWQPTVTCSTSGSYTLHTGFDTCVYTKIGRLVQVQGKLYITGESSPSGDIRISLPITSLGGLSDDSEYVVGSVNLNSHGGTLDNVVANVGAAYAYMWLTSTAADGTAATITDAHVDTSWWLTFNFSYLA